MNFCKGWEFYMDQQETSPNISMKLYLIAIYSLRTTPYSRSLPPSPSWVSRNYYFLALLNLHVSHCVSKSVLLFLGHMWFYLSKQLVYQIQNTEI